jgi:predicted dehydrogenase
MVGYGGFGEFCLQALKSLSEVRLVAVAETDPTRRQKAALLGLQTFEGAFDLLASPEIDLVHISTPPDTHAPLCMAAAQAGKHILCEKPLALSVEQATEMLAAAQANGVRLMTNYVLRYNPLNRRLQSLLSKHILGELQHLSLENWATDEPLKPEHWFWQVERSGGIWIEHGIHFFDLFHWFTGQRAEAVSATSQVRADGCLDRVWGLVRYSGGLAASFQHAFTLPARIERTTIRLACTKGYVTLNGWIPTWLMVEALLDEAGLAAFREWAGQDPLIQEHYSGDQMNGWASGTPYRASARIRAEFEQPEGKLQVYRESIRAVMADLICSIQNREHQPALTAQDALASLAVAQAATTAAQSGKWEPVLPVNSDGYQNG